MYIMEYRRNYIDVYVLITAEGKWIPKKILWRDRIFEIKRITSKIMTPVPHTGGTAMRYTCIINGSEHYLYYEQCVTKSPRWFVEEKIYF